MRSKIFISNFLGMLPPPLIRKKKIPHNRLTRPLTWHLNPIESNILLRQYIWVFNTVIYNFSTQLV